MPQLPGEIWLTILSHVRSDPQKGINHDDRAFLSRDSLNYENLPQELSDPIEDLGRFRLTCRRHAELGARELFRTYSTRFTTTSLRNLQEVAKRPGLAQHVNKFVYKMPFFYIEGKLPVKDDCHRPTNCGRPRRDRQHCESACV